MNAHAPWHLGDRRPAEPSAKLHAAEHAAAVADDDLVVLFVTDAARSAVVPATTTPSTACSTVADAPASRAATPPNAPPLPPAAISFASSCTMACPTPARIRSAWRGCADARRRRWRFDAPAAGPPPARRRLEVSIEVDGNCSSTASAGRRRRPWPQRTALAAPISAGRARLRRAAAATPPRHVAASVRPRATPSDRRGRRMARACIDSCESRARAAPSRASCRLEHAALLVARATTAC